MTSKPKGVKRSGRGALLALGIAAVVVVAAVIAVVATRSDKSAATPQAYPVQVTGTALPTLPIPPAADPGIGKTSPTLAGQSLFGGGPLTITPGGGTPQLVVFVAHWCPHCQREVPLLVQWMASAQKPADLKVVAVSTALNAEPGNYPPSAWLQREHWPTPVLADSDDSTAAQAYGLPGYPYLVVVGADGTVKARSSGELTLDQLDTFITSALAS